MAGKPGFKAYTVRDFEAEGEKKSQWLEIGIAWEHKNSEGYDIVLEALPVNGL